MKATAHNPHAAKAALIYQEERGVLPLPSRRGVIEFLRVLIALLAAAFVVCLLVSCQGIAGATANLNWISPDTGTEIGIDYRDGQGSASVKHPIHDPETGEIIAWAGVSKSFGEPPVIPEK